MVYECAAAAEAMPCRASSLHMHSKVPDGESESGSVIGQRALVSSEHA